MLKPAAGVVFKSDPIATKFEITSDMVGGHYCIVRQSIAPGQLFWPHEHRNEDQVIVVLRGAIGARVGDREWSARAGEIVYRPKGQPHAIWNAGDETTEFSARPPGVKLPTLVLWGGGKRRGRDARSWAPVRRPHIEREVRACSRGWMRSSSARGRLGSSCLSFGDGGRQVFTCGIDQF
jgi:quercetin dioxygenase-like cupin family protein